MIDDVGWYSCSLSLDLLNLGLLIHVTQLGFVFVGIMQGPGAENALGSPRWLMLHMFNHSNLKLVLFMAAGVVVMNLHKLNLNDIRDLDVRTIAAPYSWML